MGKYWLRVNPNKTFGFSAHPPPRSHDLCRIFDFQEGCFSLNRVCMQFGCSPGLVVSIQEGKKKKGL